jgi:uncharacterized membrane protein
MFSRLASSVLFTLIGVACAQADPSASVPYSAGYGATSAPQAPANMDCAGAIPSFDQVSAFDKCASCHAASKLGEDRHAAPATVNFDTAAAADAHGDQAVNLVRAGVMPPPGSGLILSQAEKEQLYEWVMCRM